MRPSIISTQRNEYGNVARGQPVSCSDLYYVSRYFHTGDFHAGRKKSTRFYARKNYISKMILIKLRIKEKYTIQIN